MGKSSQPPWRLRHWIVKEGFRAGGGGRHSVGKGGGAKKNVSATHPSPLPCWLLVGGLGSMPALTCRCGGQQTAAWYVVPVQVSLGSVGWQNDGAWRSPCLLV